MEDKLVLAQGLIGNLGPVIAIITVVAVIGWVITTWMRIRHGYPLDGAWGQAVYPRNNDEAVERVKLLTQENAQLRAEIGSIKDRLANVERIVTDEAHTLNREIEQLRGKAN
jgi:predicted metal-binding membrane protein